MDLIRIAVSRFAALFRSRPLDAELDEELRVHIELATEENVRLGMSRRPARAAALRNFGGVAQVREAYREQRGIPFLEAAAQDLRFALRQLRKSPGFSVTAIVTLALGIGATTAIFSVVKTVLLGPLPYKDPGRIVQVWTINPANDGEPLPSTAGDFAAWKARSGVFEDLAPSYDSEQTLTGAGSPQFLIGYAVSANYLRILGVQPKIGRLYTEEEDRPGGPKVALMSDHLWRTTFHSDPAIVDRAITLEGSSYTVVGVMPATFDYPTSVEVWTPAAMAPSAFDDFTHPYVRVLGRLRAGVSLKQAEQALNSLEAQITAAHPDTEAGNHVVLVPLRQELDGDIRQPLFILMGAVGIVLLIACANTAGLALARDAERQKEIAVRLALGATRLRLLRQFVTESVLLAGIGGGAGLLIALGATHFLLAIFPNDVANLNIPKVESIPIDRGVLLFAACITLLTALLFGIFPMLRATRRKASNVRVDSTRGGTASRQSNRWRSAIVVSELALSLMLLTAAGLVLSSFQKVMRANLGFQADHLLSLEVFLPQDRYPSEAPGKRRRLVTEVLRQMNALPGVKSAAATNFLPLSGFWGTTQFLLRGQTLAKHAQPPEADHRLITPQYLSTMNIPLMRGRNFTDADRMGALPVVMINQTLAKQYFADSDPLGAELNLGSADKPDWWRIVGVAGDVKAFGQDQPTHADIYKPLDQEPFPLIAFTVRTETDPASMIKSAEQALWSVDPNLPVFKAISVQTLAAQSLAVRRASSVLISAFAVLALVLGCIGIYAAMAYAVSQRTQEIGVRMALGARRVDVLGMILGSGLRITLLGVAIGLTGALVLSRLLASLLFQVSAINPLIFSSAIALLMVVAMAASFLPAHRAASVDPIRALRQE